MEFYTDIQNYTECDVHNAKIFKSILFLINMLFPWVDDEDVLDMQNNHEIEILHVV